LAGDANEFGDRAMTSKRAAIGIKTRRVIETSLPSRVRGKVV
jgi:hypothetical protein